MTLRMHHRVFNNFLPFPNFYFFINNILRFQFRLSLWDQRSRVRTTYPDRRRHPQCTLLYRYRSSFLLRPLCRWQTLNIHRQTSCTYPALRRKKKIIKPDLIFNICIGCVCVCRCVCVVVCVCINIFTFAVSSIAYISSHTHTGSSCTLWTCYTAAAEDKLFNNSVTHHDESEGSDQLPPFCHI